MYPMFQIGFEMLKYWQFLENESGPSHFIAGSVDWVDKYQAVLFQVTHRNDHASKGA